MNVNKILKSIPFRKSLILSLQEDLNLKSKMISMNESQETLSSWQQHCNDIEKRIEKEVLEYKQIIDIIKDLPEPNYNIIKLIYFERLSADNIEKEYGIPKSEEAMLEKEALKFIKKNLALKCK